VGKGDGQVASDHLFSPGCVDGPFDLEPTFFGAQPDQNMQTISIRRGDKMEDISDGIAIVVYDVAEVRQRLGEPLAVALPPGVHPPGHAVEAVVDPPLVALTLFLNDSCREQDVSLSAVSGTMTFTALYSGQPGASKEERLIEAVFDVQVTDPRELPPDGSEPDPATLSQLEGDFRFYFRLGQPAQPFPGVQ
jgi:hypothetical protein